MAPAVIVHDGNVVVDPIESVQTNGDKKPYRSSAVLHRSLESDPLKVLSAKGNYLHLENGQRVFDASGGAAVACIGHGNERFVTMTR